MGAGNVTGLANAIHPSIMVAGRVLVSFIFAAAVVGKLRHPDEFIGVVANYRLVPPVAVAWTGWLVVGLEIVVVVCLTTGFELIAGAALAMSLLCGFAVAMAINLARGRVDIDCGCFQSTLRQRLSVAFIARNLLLALALAPLMRLVRPSPSVLQLLDGFATGLVLFVLYLVVGQLQAVRAAAVNTGKRYA
jgi:uncharacterized membrane protein YphA (DoxX/SURF4 family)